MGGSLLKKEEMRANDCARTFSIFSFFITLACQPIAKWREEGICVRRCHVKLSPSRSQRRVRSREPMVNSQCWNTQAMAG